MTNRRFSLAGVLAAAIATIAVVVSVTGHSITRPIAASGRKAAEPTAGGVEDEVAARDKWFFHQRAYPAEHTPPGGLLRAVTQAAALDRDNSFGPAAPAAPSSNLAWVKNGPQPIGTIGPDASSASGTFVGSLPVAGRVSAIAPDPVNANVAYLGGANGGVWKTTDGGASWSPKFDAQPSLSMGAIAVDPFNTQNVWAGTGEPNSSGDSYYGAGIYKSTNGGTSWARQGGASFLEGCFVYDFAIVSSSIVVAAVAEWPGVTKTTCTSAQRGIWRTSNGGTNWTHVTLPNVVSFQLPTDLAQPKPAPPAANNTIYAAVYNEGVWRSTDGGATWAKLTGLTVPNYSLRGVLSVAPSNANILYVAFAANQANNFGNLAGVWKSANATAATPIFTQVVPLTLSNGPCNYPFDTYGQCSYDFDIAVDPADATVFFLGGIRLFKYTSSGASGGEVAYGSCATCIHVDQHAAVFGPGPKLWVGSDGGVYNGVSPYSGFTNRNSGGLSITEFNGWTSGSLGSTFIGGTQDNGTAKFTTATGLNWNMTHGGDGGASAYQNANTFYASYYGNDVYRTLNGGSSYTNISPAWGADGGEFYPPMEMSPTSATTLYRGTDRIWKGTTTSTAPSWSAISPHFAPVSAIGLAKSNANVIYAGFDATPMAIRYTTNGGGIWTLVPAAQIPDRYVTDLSVSPSNPNIAYAAFSGFNAATPTKPGHIFKTSNGGSVWTNVSGNLPDVPVDSISVDYAKNVIYAGTDIGVFWSTDGGTTWGRGGAGTSGLPNVPVVDIRVDGSKLVAATHGRSVYSVPAPTAIAISSFSPLNGITGSNVVISGTNLLYTKSVIFGGTKASPAVTYNPVTKQVTAKVPDGLAVAAKIKVQTGEGIFTLSASNFTPTLSITSFSPGTGAVGATVNLSGIGLSGITGVKFGSVPAVTFSAGTGTASTAVVPVGALTGKISVTTAAGTVQSATSFTVL
jgi:photosystem II stability/assembly factor-like uncharacterized protein